MGQQRETLNLLIVCQLLLQRVDTFHHHLMNLLVLAEVFAAPERDVVFMGILLQQGVDGDDERRDKLALVGDDGHLVYILVHQQLGLYHLRSDVLAVGGLEEVLDAVGEEQLAVLQVACVARVKVALLVERLRREVVAAVVALGDGGAFQHHLAVVGYLHLYAGYGPAHGADGDGLVQVAVADGGQRLGESVAHHHVEADGEDKLLHLL